MVGIFEKDIPSLVLRDPDLIKDVLIKDFSAFSDRPVFSNDKIEPLTQHLFRLKSAKWRPLRVKLSPVFTSGKLKNMFHLLLECSEHFEKYLESVARKGEPIDSRDLTARFTTDVIGSCAFGLNIKAMDDEKNEFRRMGQKIFRNGLKTYFRDRVRETPWLYRIIGRLFAEKDLEKFFITTTMDMINYRKENNIRRHDFIDILVDLKDLERLENFEITDSLLTAQAFVFFAAGFETSSSTISNAMYELALNQTVQDKLRQEIKEVLESTGGEITYDCLKEMKWLDAVIRETLRKYPPVMYLIRGSLTDYTFNGTNVTIPKNMKVYIPIYGIQNHPDIFPNPEIFDPNRFTEEAAKTRHPMFFLPFGDGPRNCIGARFAYNQTKVGVIKVIQNYKVDVCEKTPAPPYPLNMQDFIMLQPACGIYVKLIPISTC
ncbi:hypothetical protein KPH14_003745 [Odynerus spinipes]|uniref:Cytochrome P450 n=1 Tax=Odynerus spinipes TaxID=1348599 RepID=A0AAD9RXV6_9HYME|nr:hypothetical protein KPH14_003745 [Odynerus spinipes]